MIEGFKKIKFIDFKREAVELTLEAMNEHMPQDILETAQMMTELGAVALVGTVGDCAVIKNVKGLF